jgi:hypothetical protein
MTTLAAVRERCVRACNELLAVCIGCRSKGLDGNLILGLPPNVTGNLSFKE